MRGKMGIVIVFLCGIANFAMHKAVLESGHPLLRQIPVLARAMGGRFSFVLEFAILLGAMLLAGEGITGWALAYLFYSLVNALSAWLILSGRV